MLRQFRIRARDYWISHCKERGVEVCLQYRMKGIIAWEFGITEWEFAAETLFYANFENGG